LFALEPESGLALVQRYSLDEDNTRCGIEFLLQMRGALRQHQLAGGPYTSLQQVTAVRRAIAFAYHDSDNALTPRRIRRKGTGATGRTTMSKWFVNFANRVAETSGYPSVFVAAVVTVLVWLSTGPFFQFSDTWQLVMNTLTSVITFLMVFLIQTSQNRDSTALQAKLDELIRVSTAKNLFVGLEHLSPDEIEEIRRTVHGHLERRSTPSF
jgi:low affinity Fe/Cu permease